MYNCFDCGKRVSTKDTKRCHSCATKYAFKVNKLNFKGKHNGMYGRKGRKSPAYIDNRTKIKYYCKICKAKISYGNKTKLCKSCSMKKLFRNPRKHPSYIDGRTIKKHYCQCGTIIKNYYNNYCKSCGTKLSWKSNKRKNTNRTGKNNPNYDNHKLKGKNNPMFGKNKLIKHHIYLEENSTKTMLIKIKDHQKIHQGAYRYLVEKGLIKQYIKWFFRYKIKEINLEKTTMQSM